MKKSKRIDSLLLLCALTIGVVIAMLAAIRSISANTAIVFLGLCMACIAMSQIDFESPAKERKKRRK